MAAIKLVLLLIFILIPLAYVLGEYTKLNPRHFVYSVFVVFIITIVGGLTLALIGDGII